MAGIYIHIPFCKQACSYCDFHFSTLLKNKPAIIDAICKEIILRKDYLNTTAIESIYFGGGTPSLLNKKELGQIFSVLSRHFSWNQMAEITLECNPDDLNKVKLKELKEAGINRLSIGLQSFNEQELLWMNRAHNLIQSETSVNMAQDAGFDNITIDLIYGSKFLSNELWQTTIEKAINLKVQHISAYSLTIEKNTRLGRAVSKKTEERMNEDKCADQFILLMEHMEKNGFEQYEISNFAQAGKISVHNSNYWKGSKYLGVGPSAHSYNGISRQWNIANNQLYAKALNNGNTFFETENLTTKNRYNEYVLTLLRSKWGCNENDIDEQFGSDFKNYFSITIHSYIPEFVSKINSTYYLTRQGKLIADKIASDCFCE